jgi:hypothetical protein
MAAPVVLFVYARPDHTHKTLSALAHNDLASITDLIIYSDGPRTREDQEAVNAVRSLINRVQGFRSVTLHERKKNWGLANNIIDGVSQVCASHGRVIVLEDDLVTSPQFLTFMNQALDYFADAPKVWHISGWNYPVNMSDLGDAFLWRCMNCWGWGTWSDKWANFSKDPEKLIRRFARSQVRRFDLEGVGRFWSQVLANRQNQINTWAVFWYASIFQNDGLCLNPTTSYVKNIGFDGSGMHCGFESIYETKNLGSKSRFDLGIPVEESNEALRRIKKYLEGRSKSKIRAYLGRVKRQFFY